MQMLQADSEGLVDDNLKAKLKEFLGPSNSVETEWLNDCIVQGMQHYLDIDTNRRSLRLPAILAEESYISDLRRGAALRSLRRIHMACRVEKIIHDCVDGIIAGKYRVKFFEICFTTIGTQSINFASLSLFIELGYEQLGQRGCPTSNLATLDIDMKARLVSTEELTLSINILFSKVDHKAPASWWDRSCDIALLLGTFVHGLGNYEAILNDETLPFMRKISKYAKSDIMCCDAQTRFANATVAAKNVCDDALEASKLKAQKEVQKAVAAAAAASLKREKEAAALREGGVAADAVISKMGEQPMDHLYEIQEGRDDHFITLPRLKKAIESSIRSNSSSLTSSDVKADTSSSSSATKETKGTEENKGRRKRNMFHTLPMPDARVLNFRLKLLVAGIERKYHDSAKDELSFEFMTPKVWPASKTVLQNQRLRSSSARFTMQYDSKESLDHIIEYAGIGFNGTQCGVMHRTIDDRTDFSIGAASPDLYQVAHGPESPRYLRALGVPMTFGRFGLVSLVYADEECLKNMLENERKRFYNNGDKPIALTEKKEANTETGDSKQLKPVEQKVETSVKSDISTSNGEASKIFKSVLTNVVPTPFRDNAVLRAGVTSVLLYFGHPIAGTEESKICPNFLKIIQDLPNVDPSEISQNRLFGKDRFEELLQHFVGDANIPKLDCVNDYIDGHLLPHCLKLCVYGNSATTRITRGSKGEYETSDGTSCYPEPTEKLQSPFPDPCLPLTEHSMEAVGVASAILRRVRLMRCILKISSGEIQNNKLQEILHSKILRKSMNGLPIWWCPWIHDVALLFHASTRGLFSILRDLESDSGREAGPIFSRKAVREHIRSTLFADASLARSIMGASSPQDAATWIQQYASEFPSLNTIERRLAFLCAKLTEDIENESRYVNLPMYDHGGWPRN